MADFITAYSFTLPHIGEYRFWNPRNFCLWNLESRKICLCNPESWALEPGIQLKESGLIHTKDCNPESTVWNPESKTVFQSLAYGD